MNAPADFDDLAARMERGLTTVADVDLLAQLRARLLRYELALTNIFLCCDGQAERLAAQAIEESQ